VSCVSTGAGSQLSQRLPCVLISARRECRNGHLFAGAGAGAALLPPMMIIMMMATTTARTVKVAKVKVVMVVSDDDDGAGEIGAHGDDGPVIK
jgi:hypothetical protein